jgi:predicted small lipoprotein YifL
MIRRLAVLGALAATLAGCGADGPPQRPSDAPASGIAVTGEARMGVQTNG